MKCSVFALGLTVITLTLYGQPDACCKKREAGIYILVFLATDCPVSQKYVPVLNAIQQKYQEQPVVLQSIVPSASSKGEARKFRRAYNISFHIKPDRNFECARALAAQTTPEVFVFDKNMVLRYRGAIDNWFYDLGGYRQQTTENYLIDAIDSLLAGEDPPIANATPIGCPIHIP